MRIRGQGTADIFDGVSSKEARATLPADLHRIARRKLLLVDATVQLRDLASPPGNHLEALSGDRAGQHGIRINDQYRICFRWESGEAIDVEIVDYH